MSLRKSIRWRIQAWHGLLLLTVIGGFCITAWRLERANLLRIADHELELRLSALGTALTQGPPKGGGGGSGPDERPQRGQPPRPQGDGDRTPSAVGNIRADAPPPDEEEPGWEEMPPEDPPRGQPPSSREDPREQRGPQGPPPGFRTAQMNAMFNPKDAVPYYYVTWTRRGGLLDTSATAPTGVVRPPSDDPAFAKGIRTREGFREAFLFTPPGEGLLVGQSLAGIDREMHDFGWKLAGTGGSVLIAGLAIGWWIASRAMRPIAHISAAATRIADGHFNERIRTEETESELGKLATLLDNTFQRLDAAFDEQARFTSDAAHELRTPVSIILGQAQLALSKERSPSDYKAAFEVCQRAAKRMHGLIESLLQLSVLDAAPHEMETRSCDLADLARDHTNMMEVVAAEKGIRILEDLSSAPCRGNPDQLAQILANLLTNAVKYSPQGAEVHVRTRLDAGTAVLTIRDTGPGIAGEHLPHLFERFYRADASRNRSTGGAGLGLAICKRIADAHGAALTVEGTLGKGTTVTLRMPPVQ